MRTQSLNDLDIQDAISLTSTDNQNNLSNQSIISMPELRLHIVQGLKVAGHHLLSTSEQIDTNIYYKGNPEFGTGMKNSPNIKQLN